MEDTVNYDPAWDMPFKNYQQGGSFPIAVTPPEDGPGSEPLVCLPPINRYWLPLLLGCLDQLCNPSTWSTTSDDELNLALENAQLLKAMLGGRAECPVQFLLRVSSCELQYSIDAGFTWTMVDGWDLFLADCIPPQTLISFDSGCTLSESLDGGTTYEAVPGWIDNFSQCVQKYTPIIGIPPNPNDQTPDQLSCSIATYVANQIVIGAMGKAVTAIQDDLTLLAFGANILDFIPEFVLVRAGYDAIAIIYGAVSEGTLSDYEDAIADGTLLQDIACAIYGCVVGAGYIRPGNFHCIVTNVAAISYTHSDVITAIVDYLNALGPTSLAQLSQVAGLETGADCSTCAGWCHTFDFTVDDGGWEPYPSEDGLPAAVYSPGVGWTQYLPPTGGSQIRIQQPITVTPDVTAMSVDSFTASAQSVSSCIVTILSGSETFRQCTTETGSGGHNHFASVGWGADNFLVSNDGADASVFTAITRIVVEGNGDDPFTGYPC